MNLSQAETLKQYLAMGMAKVDVVTHPELSERTHYDILMGWGEFELLAYWLSYKDSRNLQAEEDARTDAYVKLVEKKLDELSTIRKTYSDAQDIYDQQIKMGCIDNGSMSVHYCRLFIYDELCLGQRFDGLFEVYVGNRLEEYDTLLDAERNLAIFCIEQRGDK